MSARFPLRFAAALIGLICALGAPRAARAADDGGSRSILNESAGARGTSLGNAFTALADDASGPLWNPAGLGFIGRQEFQASHADLFGTGLSEKFVGAVLPSWRWGVLGLTFRHFGVTGIEGRDDRNVITATDLSDGEDQLALSYGRAFGEAWSLGGSFKLRRQSLAGASASGFGADLGVQLRPGLLLLAGPDWLQDTRLGLSVQNVVQPALRLDRDNVPDPAVVRVGMAQSVRLGGARFLMATVDMEQSSDTRPRLHAGAELRLHPAFSVRAGLDRGALTAGTSLCWRDLALEYSLADRDLGAVQNFGVSVRFGATVDERHRAALDAEETRLQGRLAAAFDRRQSDRTTALVAAVEKALAEKDYDAALENLGVLNTLTPGLPRAAALEAAGWRGRGGALESAGSFSDAALAYARALEVAPDDSLAASGLRRSRAEGDRRAARTTALRDRFAAALDAFARGQLIAARDAFAALLVGEPGDAEAARMLARTREAIDRRAAELLAEADQLTRSAQFDQAAQRLALARELAPGSVDVARVEGALGRARRTAEEQARAAGATGRGTGGAPGASAASVPAQAGASPAKGAALSPQRRREVEDLYQRGLAAVRAERTDEALRYWELVHAADPGHAQVGEFLKREYLTRGMDAYAAGRLSDAVDSWQRVLKIDPNDRKAVGYLARAEQQLSRSREIMGGRR